MHEQFLTAVISDADFHRATAVLQGLCAMTAWQSTHRVLFFSSPPGAPRGLSNSRSLQPSPYGNLWKELSQQLARQSFIIRLRYEVFKDKDFGIVGAANGTAASAGPRSVNFNASLGTLRWTDIPDHTGERPVTQRKKVEIPDQRNLVAVLEDNNYKIKSELIEQSYAYFRDGIEYSLVRYLHLPEPPVGVAYTPQPLPAWDALTPVDAADKWILFVRSHVLEDNSPEKMVAAHEELMAVQKELLGVFEFKAFDRRAHDTRMAQQPMPPVGLRA